MERKIHLQVCSGTTCFVMGGSDLLTIFEHLSLEERERVTLAAVPCFEHCKSWEQSRPPFVTIDGKLYDHMNLEKTVHVIREKIAQ